MVINRSQMRKQISTGRKKRRDPKVGTGKKPKGSGRRLYTDENPKDTVRIAFATPQDARKTVAKVKWRTTCQSYGQNTGSQHI